MMSKDDDGDNSFVSLLCNFCFPKLHMMPSLDLTFTEVEFNAATARLLVMRIPLPRPIESVALSGMRIFTVPPLKCYILSYGTVRAPQ